ncbi:MAG TPA: signal peptidase I [Candidatus Saccharimonadales bacterium]|nr:signal peptidase I [Candidatus Saccharimonadales bacterium]
MDDSSHHPTLKPADEPVEPMPPEPELTSEAETENSPSSWREFFSFLGILLAALGIAFLMISFVFRSYQVDGPSMESTLQNQDKLIIWKVPRTWSRVTHHSYIPARGDVIVFEESGLSSYGQEDKKQLIKRVVGLPGDHVVVKDNVLTIYNRAHPKGFQPDQKLGYNKDHHLPAITSGNVDVSLGPGQLFVCGDNRPDSLDSRYFGPISAQQVIGKLVLRIFPINKVTAF